MADEEIDPSDTPSAETSAGGDMAVAERPRPIDPIGWMGDWFEHWPPMFGRRFPELFERTVGGADAMRLEEFVEDGTRVIRAELPGMDPDEDIEITVDAGRLDIRATREQRSTTTENGFRSEFRYGSFQRSMSLPAGVTADDIEASYTDGILEIRLPVDSDAEARTTVPISRAAKS